MKTANLTEVKNNLSRYVDHVGRGGRVRILSRGVPVADLVPVASVKTRDGEDRWNLIELERRGLARPRGSAWPSELDTPGPRVRGSAAIEALLGDRRRR